MKRTLSTIVFLAVLGLGSSLSAYVTMGVKWSDSDLPVGIYISQTLSNELADQVAVDAIWASFMTWQNVDCSYVQFVNKGRTTSTSWGISDGKNVISWRESNWPDSKYALAVTSVLGSQYSGGNIFDADMIFNGVNFSWAVDGNKNKVDLISVATHEAGHLIGLDHSPIYSATMYASTSEGMTHQRTLHDDDIAGVCSIYPIDSAPNLPPKEEPKPLNPGDTCSFTFECGSLSCINDGKEKYCASGCQSDSDCGQGFTCIGATQGSICVKTTNLGPTPTQGLGDSCSSQLLCLSSMVCIGDNGANYCTQNCSSATCPSGYSCVPAGTTQVCVKSAAPVEPTKKIGDNCSDNSPCGSSLLCISDNSATYCTQNCGGAVACPSGYACTAAGTVSVCVKSVTPVDSPTIDNPTIDNPTTGTPTTGTPTTGTPTGTTGGTTGTNGTPVTGGTDPTTSLEKKPSSGCSVTNAGANPSSLVGLLLLLLGGVIILWRRRTI